MQNTINSINSTDSTNATNSTQSTYLSPEYLRNVAWQFRQALHLSDQETIDNLLNSATLTLTKKNLLKAMLLGWQNSKKAKTSLEDLLKGTDLVDKLWVCFALSEFYLTQGNTEDSEHYCDFAVKQIINKQSILPSYLCCLLAIWNINVKLAADKSSELNYQQLFIELNQIITSSDIKLIKGYSYFILGKLEKLNPTSNNNSTNNSSSSNSSSNNSSNTGNSLAYFHQAIKELENIDYYYLSLAQIEMATIGKLELSERRKLILSAQSNFKQLKKLSELDKLDYLLSELTSQPIIASKYPYESIGNCLFASPAMKKIKQELEILTRYSNNDLILILGEKGTGKERVASTIEELSGKKMQPYNCSNLSKELFESVMFGHKKGAFTGANEDKMGLFEAIGDGILFLDEIGDLPFDCQAKFLRVLQERDFARMGEEVKMRRFNGRIVAATNKDLKKMVEDGQFRGDLFDRLNVLVINLPSLKERKEEIIPLAEFFLQLHGQGESFVLSQSARDYLTQKEHLGNIRGLETDIKRVIVKALSQSTRIITKELLTDKLFTDTINKESLLEQLDQIEPFDMAMNKHGRKLVLTAIELCDGNKTSAMHLLRIHKSRFYRLLDQYKIKH